MSEAAVLIMAAGIGIACGTLIPQAIVAILCTPETEPSTQRTIYLVSILPAVVIAMIAGRFVTSTFS